MCNELGDLKYLDFSSGLDLNLARSLLVVPHRTPDDSGGRHNLGFRVAFR
jgi:hypothetical protein